MRPPPEFLCKDGYAQDTLSDPRAPYPSTAVWRTSLPLGLAIQPMDAIAGTAVNRHPYHVRATRIRSYSPVVICECRTGARKSLCGAALIIYVRSELQAAGFGSSDGPLVYTMT